MEVLRLLKNRAVLSNTLGNILEWYDFTLYGILAVLIAKVFFPTEDPTAGLLLTFTIFAVGFLMRPIGGIIYGHIGDRYGRKKALVSSIILMTLATVALGLLPSYQTLGITASILMALVRMFQGIAVGGEFTGTMSFLVETAPSDRRGLFGSFALVGVLAGILLGTGVISIVSFIMPMESFSSWGWRLPFLFSAVIGIVVLVLRTHIKEPEIFIKTEAKLKHNQIPIIDALEHSKKPIFQGFVITIFNSFAFYILMIYVVTYFNRVLKMDITAATTMNLYMVTLTLIFVPVFGIASDYFGRKALMGISALMFIILGYPMDLYFLSNAHAFGLYLGQSLICILLAMYLGPMATLLAELMPTKVRYTGVSIAYNTALALFGGTTPLINTYMITQLNIITAPGVLLTVSAIISLIGLLTIKDRYRLPLK